MLNIKNIYLHEVKGNMRVASHILMQPDIPDTRLKDTQQRAEQIAKDLGNSKATNMVLLGAVSSLLPLSDESLQKAIKTLFERKGEKIVAKNLEAYEKGKEVAVEFIL